MYLGVLAKFATIGTLGERRRLSIFGMTILGAALGGCQTVAPLVASADPGVQVRRVAYRSTVAPYFSLRPSTPALWRERNEAVTPKRKGEGDER
ncbi:hypothetical protein ACVIHI_009061 [Bradyrhizobium sp. USDA 4524]|nr:hypothetical protein [Bradyrhizobium sp. USDA 4538]MCP1907206.1 hypothetical protein [Bradyrhizobium sp. USDA 4537]MCP1985682.1 hypothetical protein [Bradyrhizobium sp. USDA 4539]